MLSNDVAFETVPRVRTVLFPNRQVSPSFPKYLDEYSTHTLYGWRNHLSMKEVILAELKRRGVFV